jgi:hypothetical protein
MYRGLRRTYRLLCNRGQASLGKQSLVIAAIIKVEGIRLKKLYGHQSR